MQVVEPQVFLIGESRPMYDGMRQMLTAIGAKDWEAKYSTPPELLIEVAGRLCYKSFAVGLNPNVTKIREGNHEYIGNILKQKHGSVLEHSSTTVAFIGVSRIFTHELVRHRAGCAYSQESMRYVRMEDIGVYVPDAIANHPDPMVAQTYLKAVREAEEAYAALSDLTSINDMKDFHTKKELTSAFRRIAPGGHTTNIIMTANHRAWRHMIEMRTSDGAEEEIRKVFSEVARLFKGTYPALYQDMQYAPPNSITFEHSKV